MIYWAVREESTGEYINYRHTNVRSSAPRLCQSRGRAEALRKYQRSPEKYRVVQVELLEIFDEDI